MSSRFISGPSGFAPEGLFHFPWPGDYGTSQNRPKGRKQRKTDEYGKVINRLRVIDSLVEEKGREKETFPLEHCLGYSKLALMVWSWWCWEDGAWSCGDLWNRFNIHQGQDFKELIAHFQKLQRLVS